MRLVEKTKVLAISSFVFTSCVVLSWAFLTNPATFADTGATNKVSVTVPVACSFSGSIDAPHTASVNSGTSKEDIGTTTLKVFCNDNNGYSIYAIGSSNNEDGNNKLIATVNNTLSPTHDIVTGLSTSGNTSNWAMKLSKVAGTYEPTILSDTNGSFANYHTIPEQYTKVATLNSATDFTIGSSLKSTYRAYVSGTQPAGTYRGQVKYTLVHPNDTNPPRPEVPLSQTAFLQDGPTVKGKLRYSGSPEIELKAIADLPVNFLSTDENTLTTQDSPSPVYFYQGKLYTDARKIYLHQNSTSLFSLEEIEVDCSFLDLLDTSRVTNMSAMFFRGKSANCAALANWDVSNVTDMSDMFGAEGGNSLQGSPNTLANWDVSNVTNMSGMFDTSSAFFTSVEALANWDVSSVTNMNYMFTHLYKADASVLDNWNVSKVEEMRETFRDLSRDKLPSWYGDAQLDYGSAVCEKMIRVANEDYWGCGDDDYAINSIIKASTLPDHFIPSDNNTISSVSSIHPAYIFFDNSTKTMYFYSRAQKIYLNENSSSMFHYFHSLEDISGLAFLDASNVIDMSEMFEEANNIDATVLNGWNVSKVTDKSNAFTCPVDKQPSWY